MDYYFFQAFSIQGLFMLFLLIVTSIMTIILIIKNKKEDKKEKSLITWIEKKDILYWLLIICLGSISVVTYEYRDNEEAISHWGFAGTIVSIILALVAIGFTLFQTLASNLSSEKIAVSADKIEKASAGLDSTVLLQASEILTNASQNIAEYNSKVDIRLDKLTEELLAIKNAQYDSGNKLNEFFSIYESSSLGVSENGISIQSSELLDINDFIEKVYTNMSYIPQFFIYSYLFLDEEKNLRNGNNHRNFVKAFSNLKIKQKGDVTVTTKEREYFNTYYPAYYGYLAACKTFINSFGILNFIQKMDEEDRKEMLNRFEQLIKPQDVEFLKQFLEEKE